MRCNRASDAEPLRLTGQHSLGNEDWRERTVSAARGPLFWFASRISTGKRPCGHLTADSRILGNDPVPGYQGWGDFRGRLNLPLIVETLLMRCVAPAPSGVSTYAQLWFAIF